MKIDVTDMELIYLRQGLIHLEAQVKKEKLNITNGETERHDTALRGIEDLFKKLD